MEPVHIISLGAGVQSSRLALGASRGEFGGGVAGAIFADTQSEPHYIYEWLDFLEKHLSFPVYRVTAGDLWASELRVRRSKKSGKLYLKNSIPAFVVSPEGKIGLLGRKCTSDFKIIPLQRKVRELVGIKRAGGGVVRCKMWIGISIDEAHRMKPSRVDYIENCWPLVEARETRKDCLNWMKQHGYPEPPRSACTFCPFHSDAEWLKMKTNELGEFQNAVRFEQQLQQAAKNQEVLRGLPFLHSSGKPLSDIDFAALNQKSHEQISLFGNECEGMCGV